MARKFYYQEDELEGWSIRIYKDGHATAKKDSKLLRADSEDEIREMIMEEEGIYFDNDENSVISSDNEALACCPRCSTEATEDEAIDSDGNIFKFKCSNCNYDFSAELDNIKCDTCGKRIAREYAYSDAGGDYCSKECSDKSWKNPNPPSLIRENVTMEDNVEVAVCPECGYTMNEGECESDDDVTFNFECSNCAYEFSAELNNVNCDSCECLIAESEAIKKDGNNFCCQECCDLGALIDCDNDDCDYAGKVVESKAIKKGSMRFCSDECCRSYYSRHRI